jgi:hypothetical protein
MNVHIMQTLKQKYMKNALTEKLMHRIVSADNKVLSALNEQKKHELILEDFNKQQMAQATDVINKLKSLNFSGLQSLTQARDKAISDVTAALTNSSEKGIVRKILNLFSDQKENPLVDALAFTGAVYNFFQVFSQYVKSIAGNDTEKSILELVTGKTKDELDDINAVQGLGKEEKTKIDNIKKLIAKGLKPEGKINLISKNWVDKYLGGKSGLENFSNELVNVSVKDLQTIINDTTNSLKTIESVNDSVANASEKSTMPSSSTTGSEKSTSAEKTSSTKQTTANAATTKTPSDKKEKAILALKNAKVDQATIKKVMLALTKNGLL